MGAVSFNFIEDLLRTIAQEEIASEELLPNDSGGCYICDFISKITHINCKIV